MSAPAFSDRVIRDFDSMALKQGDSTDLATIPTPIRNEQNCTSSSDAGHQTTETAESAPVPNEFPSREGQRVSVYSLAGKMLAEVTVTADDTVGVMKEKLCDATGANQYMDLASQLSVLRDSDSIAMTGILETCHVQALVPSVTRFFSSTTDRQFGVYLASTGSCQIFSLQTRVVNRREDEEHVQTAFWGSWTSGSGSHNVEVHISKMERKVYNDSIPYGWTQQSGKTAADLSVRMFWHRKLLQVKSVGPLGEGLGAGDSCILAALLHFPEEFTSCSEAHVFDDWYAAGTSTEP